MLVLTFFNTRKCDEMNQHNGTMDVMDVTTKNMLFHHGKKRAFSRYFKGNSWQKELFSIVGRLRFPA